MRDTIPNKPVPGECAVMNLDSSGGKGTHWVAWVCSTDNNTKFSVYFDSFGLPMPDNLLKYLKKIGKIFINNEQIQQDSSVRCGYYCIDFIESCHGKSLSQIADWLYEYIPVNTVGSSKNESDLIKKFKIV